MRLAEGDIMSTKSEIARLYGVIQRAQSKIALIREGCLHPGAVKKHKANTGNYDPSSDCYWTEFNCPECGKFWIVDGSV